eukprot:GHVP01000634.1.p1 GENE.GHVP01000634.1~~GHVP01000634.1.p1  ORF type:complete len:264 (+),score=34.92 GHVP01000634.1:212-1003(+)
MGKRSNKRTLVSTSRTLGMRERHVVDDIIKIMPHSKKTARFDIRKDMSELNEVISLNKADNGIYVERNHKEGVSNLWISNGLSEPSIKFQLIGSESIKEMRSDGNCFILSTPILSFENSFNRYKEYIIIKNSLIGIFGTPKHHKKSNNKKLIDQYDRMFHFSIVDGKIWFRHYGINSDRNTGTLNDIKGEGISKGNSRGNSIDDSIDRGIGNNIANNLSNNIDILEIGPRIIITPMKILSGSFKGDVLWETGGTMTEDIIERE